MTDARDRMPMPVPNDMRQGSEPTMPMRQQARFSRTPRGPAAAPPLPHRARWRGVLPVLSVTAALALSACASSPDSQYYTLTGPVDQTAGSAGTATAMPTPAPVNTGRPLLIELEPVNVPSQVSRPQIVLTTSPGQIKIEDYKRWSSSLGDEIGSALSATLTRDLGAIDTYRTPRPPGSTVYRITVNVQGFESLPGERATIDAVWSVVRSSDSVTMTCRSRASEPIGAGYDSLAAGHRKALARISSDIAQGVRAEQTIAPVTPDDDVPAPIPTTVSGKGKSKDKNAVVSVTPVKVTAPVPLCPVTSTAN